MPDVQTKRETARYLLRELFADRPRLAIAEVVEWGAAFDVSRQTLTRACRDLGVREIHNGPFGAFWQLDPTDNPKLETPHA